MKDSENKKEWIGVIIGAGHFAEVQLEAWQSVEGGKIKGIYSLDRDRSVALAQRFDLTVFDDFYQMVIDIKPDFVDICTPPDSHWLYTKLSADLGLAVLCQKPVAPSYTKSLELIQYCLLKKVPLMINENWRWQGWYRQMKEMISQELLGQVYTSYFAMRPGDGWGDTPYPAQPYFKDMKKFLIFETGVHYIDTFRYLFGEVESVYCQLRKINPIIQGEDLAIVHFNFLNGVTAMYDANRTTYMEEVRTPAYGWMTIEGTMGKLRLESDGRIFYTPREGIETAVDYNIPSGWKGGSAIATQQHFIDGLKGGTSFESSGEEYIKTLKIVEACYLSANNDQVIRIEEI